MKRHIYTIAFFLTLASAAQAQTPIKQTHEQVADVLLFGDDLLLSTKKEADGQYIYVERRGSLGEPQKEPALNAGHTNTMIGSNPAAQELYVYQKNSRNDEKIVVYAYRNGAFEKTEERPLPRMHNNSYNLGLFLNESKSDLYLSGELGKSHGYDDIYRSTWQGGRWSKLKNLGKQVNTKQPEFAPYVTGDSLYFSRRQDEAAYVYVLPLKDGEAAGEATKLGEPVNTASAFNAYYRKAGDRETWISAAGKADEPVLTAYVTEAPAPPVAVAEQPKPLAEAPVIVAPAPAPAVRRTADLQLGYGFNEVFLKPGELKVLQRYLAKQPSGATFTVTGYSDARGTAQAKQQVSRRRAAYIKWYIDKYYSAKGFTVRTDHVVEAGTGPDSRKSELLKAQ
ncbi:hypothetical protein I2I11_06165 [Pontibacter sp. 172403-2]|uniref:OmpA family protein n=1 Tax=Pontibacter rufus TaxID=2791028 RepID=UPI0018B00254|nr:hypothetical protein [Pontibacter sp. 172403-2]MBF9252867.1 hypothetical protein [Pontibacter sp. 172403-2]